MKKSFALLSFAGLMGVSSLSLADSLSLYAGVGLWKTDISGDIGANDTALVDASDLGISDQDNNFVYAAFEHPIPIIPNIRLQYTNAAMSGTGTLSQDLVIDGETFSATATVATKFDASHIDATLYYELLDNWVNLDFGLTVRQFDGKFEVQEVGTNNFEEEDFDEAVPLLYLKAQFDLPLTGFYVSASGNALSYDDVSMIDYQAAFGYLSDGWVMDLGVEVGFRSLNFQFEGDDTGDTEADITMDGVYASLNIHF